MKTHLLKLLLLTNHLGCRPQRARIASALLALTLFALAGPVAHAQTTAFTYQGSLADGGRPANGNYDFRFTLHDAPNGGVPVAGPLTNAPVTVSNGLFTTTLDFGAGAFPGADRYLEIATRTTGVAIAYTSLTPLQKVNSAPYANRALVAGEAVRAASVADGSIRPSSFEAGAVSASLRAGGEGTVFPGALMLVGPSGTAPVDLGWVKIGTTVLGDSWTAHGNGAPPAARRNHTTVWTGTDMIVWVGLSGGTYFNTCGRYDPVGNCWKPVNTVGAPSGRAYHTMVWATFGSPVKKRAIVWGGFGSSGAVNTGGLYDPVADTWNTPTTVSTSPPNTPGARFHHTAVWTGTEMIIWGGFNGGALATGGRYNPANNIWNQVATTPGGNVPPACYYHTAVWTGTEMLVWGGFNGANPVIPIVYRYTPSGVAGSWALTTTPPGAPSGRYGHTALWTGSPVNEMIVWGGYDNVIVLNTGARFNPAAGTWLQMAPGAPAARSSHSAVWTGAGNEMIVWGGYDPAVANQGLNTGARYTPLGGGGLGSWTSATTLTGPVPAARFQHSAVWTGTEMIVWGGGPSSGVLNDGGRYTPSPGAGSWTPVATSGAPSPRVSHTAVWTGTKMIVWGGQFSFPAIYLNDGGIFDCVASCWAPLPNTLPNTPSARAGHTAVWTGSEMLVWGGFNGVALGDGGRYNPIPSPGTWTPIPNGMPNAPVARSSHTTVWTGSEMLVWGGNNGANKYNDVGRFNPAGGGSWSSLIPFGSPPTARNQHTAAWFSDASISVPAPGVGVVWGGVDTGGGFLNTGGRFYPGPVGNQGSWAAVDSTGVNVPSARHLHSGITAGSEMIVWGGRPNGPGINGFWNNGGRYDPVADTWKTVSLGANVPSARGVHSAVWTGSKMIIHGGFNTSFAFNDGGCYDPLTDTWAAVTPPPATLVPHYAHTAVMGGIQMIVFGGWNGSGTYYNDTWCYTPCQTVCIYSFADPR